MNGTGRHASRSALIDERLDVKASSVRVTDEAVTVELVDGRTISVPTRWFPRLVHATARERRNYEIGEFGIEWPDVEADLSIRGILLGRRSGENPACFRYWLRNRKRGKRVTVEEWLRRRVGNASPARKGESNRRSFKGLVHKRTKRKS